MADLQVYNYSGQPLDVESGGISYSMPVGAHRLEIDAASVTITRADSSNFSVSLDTGRTDVTVSTTGHNVVQAETFYSNYAEGMGLGIAILFAAMALRMLKQLGYHSQDI